MENTGKTLRQRHWRLAGTRTTMALIVCLLFTFAVPLPRSMLSLNKWRHRSP